MEVNCAEECVNGCILGDKCPHLEHRQAAAKFISETSIDEMVEIAAERARRKALEAQAKYAFPNRQE
ncbi:MAG: hypothetical protein KME35_00465 [Aphanocapsa sp. GSE-SYN-MK-11-07L]|jgi:hypothetical protein|nr:hypothetical protein [Aphanocapsa sp. GSE-SYN-MK-11-07L]